MKSLRQVKYPTFDAVLKFDLGTPKNVKVTAVQTLENFCRLIWWQKCSVEGT